MSDLAALILAAGGSSRLGQPKQLLHYQGKSLLSRAVETALAADCSPVCVVVGSDADRMMQELDGQPVEFAINVEWSRGMGSSIRAGVSRLLQLQPSLQRLVLMLCDQPMVAAATIARLARLQDETGKPVCVSRHDGVISPPVLVTQPIVPMLLDLPDDSGAKLLWQKHPDRLAYLDCPEAAMDVDTPGDVERLGK